MRLGLVERLWPLGGNGLGDFKRMKVGQRVFVCLVAVAMSGAGFGQAPTATEQSSPGPDAAGGLVIEPTELPTTYPQGQYHVNFQGRGYFVPAVHLRGGGGGFTA